MHSCAQKCKILQNYEFNFFALDLDFALFLCACPVITIWAERKNVSSICGSWTSDISDIMFRKDRLFSGFLFGFLPLPSFWKYIDPILNILKIYENGSSRFPGPRLSHFVKWLNGQSFHFQKRIPNILWYASCISCNLLVSRLSAYGSWLKAHGSWLMAYGSWLMAIAPNFLLAMIHEP